MTSNPPPVLCEACESSYIAGQVCPECGTETCSQCGWCDECAAQTITSAELAQRAYGGEDTDDDFVQDRHVDLDAGEFGGAMTDADYYDRTATELAQRVHGPEHDARCIYCEHGPYCPACPPPDSIPDDAHVCASCRETITRGEIAADPYYSGNWP